MDLQERAVATARVVQRADVAAIAEARRWVTAFAAEHGMNEERRSDLAVAVSEAVTNAVRHAYPASGPGEVILDAATDGEWLTVQITDYGCGTSQSSSLGLGLPLMTELAERMEFCPARDGGGTLVLMEFPVDPPADLPREGHRRTPALARRTRWAPAVPVRRLDSRCAPE